MTTFTSADIPSDITTIEQLAAWSCLILHRYNAGVTVTEKAGFLPENRAQASLINGDGGIDRFVFRISLELDPEYSSNRNYKLWHFVKPLTLTELSPNFKTT